MSGTGNERAGMSLEEPSASFESLAGIRSPASRMPRLVSGAWTDQFRALATAILASVEERGVAPVFADGAPTLFQYAFGGDRVIPFVDDVTLLVRRPDTWFRRLWHRRSLSYALRHLPLVLASSESTAAVLRDMASPATNIAVCRPLIADVYAATPFLERAASTRHVPPRGRVDVALFVSRASVPGLLAAADAVAHLRKTHGHETRLHVIGREIGIDVPDGILERPGVVFHGFVPPERVREILMSAHALLSTSDGLRLADVPFEAAFAGLPAVMPDRPLFREAFVGTAAYVDPASPASIAARIASVVTTPDIFRAAAAAAPANLSRWNDLARRDRAAVIDGLDRAGLATEGVGRAIPFLPSRFRP